MVKLRLKLCYVNDPTSTFNENEDIIYNEFLSSGNVQPRQNTTDFLNVDNNVLALTNLENQETTIFLGDNNNQTNDTVD